MIPAMILRIGGGGGNGGLSGGQVAGIVIGVALFIAILIIVIIFVLRNRKKVDHDDDLVSEQEIFVCTTGSPGSQMRRQKNHCGHL